MELAKFSLSQLPICSFVAAKMERGLDVEKPAPMPVEAGLGDSAKKAAEASQMERVMTPDELQKNNPDYGRIDVCPLRICLPWR